MPLGSRSAASASSAARSPRPPSSVTPSARPSPVAKAAVVGAAVSPGPVAGRQGRRRRCRRHPGTPPDLIAREGDLPQIRTGPRSASRPGVLPCPRWLVVERRLGGRGIAVDLGGDLLVDRLGHDPVGLRERLLDLDDGRVLDEGDDARRVRRQDALRARPRGSTDGPRCGPCRSRPRGRRHRPRRPGSTAGRARRARRHRRRPTSGRSWCCAR